jgi:hypothetical protein
MEITIVGAFFITSCFLARFLHTHHASHTCRLGWHGYVLDRLDWQFITRLQVNLLT